MNQLFPLRVLLFHTLFLSLLFMLFHWIGITTSIPSSPTLLRWDANWYNSIHLHGYLYSATSQSNSGFFPMLPLLWNVLGVGPLGMSITNALIGFFSLFFISQIFQVQNKNLLLFLSLPSLFFMYVPYTESLFVLFSCFVLYGLKQNKKGYAAAGFFLASTTKATALFFIPSLLFILLFLPPLSKLNMRHFLKDIAFYVLFIFLGIAVVVIIEYAETGVWFAYFIAQSKHWSRSFNLPIFPLTTWDAYRLLYLDAFAFMIGVIALLLCLKKIIHSLFQKTFFECNEDKSYWFSCCFLAMVLLSILFFNPCDDATHTTSILSINRYMLVSPFMLLFINQHLESKQPTLPYFAQLLSTLLLCWILFYAYSDTKNRLGFLLLSGYLLCFLLLMQKRSLTAIWAIAYLAGCCTQLILFNSFMQGLWVG